MKTVIKVKLPVEKKMFCGCRTVENETCPVCKKEAGAFRILNKETVEAAIALTLSFGSELNQYTLFDRVKIGEGGYDLLSQYSYPVGKGGNLVLDEDRNIRIEAVRLYEGEQGEACAAIIIEEKPLCEEEALALEQKAATIFSGLSVKDWKIEKEEQPEQILFLPDAALPPVIISQWWTDQIAAKYPELIHIEEPEVEEDDIF